MEYDWVTGVEADAEKFAIVFAAMGVNMETSHYFKRVCHLF